MASLGPQSLPQPAPVVLPALVTALARRPGRILVSWSMAGGLVSGGFLVTASTLAGEELGSAAAQLTLLLWALGAGAGIAHGALLAYLSRNLCRTSGAVLGDLLRCAVWILPGLAVSAVLSLWISMAGPVLRGVRPGVVEAVGIFGTWVLGLLILAWAVVEGVVGLRTIYRRWPDLRLASVMGSVVFAVLVTLFIMDPPEIWFTDLRVTGVAAVVLAFFASLWIALPVAVAALSLVRRGRLRP